LGVVRSDEEVGRNSPNQDARDDVLPPKNANKLGEVNEERARKVGERRDAIVRMIANFGPMGAPDLCERLAQDCDIKASAQTVRDDCAALAEDNQLVTVGRKWDVVREISEALPVPVGFSTNGHGEH
jgi:hypothetical protein